MDGEMPGRIFCRLDGSDKLPLFDVVVDAPVCHVNRGTFTNQANVVVLYWDFGFSDVLLYMGRVTVLSHE